MEVNRRIMALAAALSVMTLVAGVHVASAQDQSAAAGIAVVDVQFLMENSAAANDVRVRIERVQAEYQQEAEANMQGITESYERILVDRASLSDDAYQLRLLELRERAAARQSEALQRQGRLDDALRDALRRIAAAIGQVVDEITGEQGLAMVLPRSAILGTPAVPDLTEEVLVRLDRRIQSVAIDLPK